MDIVVVVGLIAGAVTSMGFIPQLIKAYRTKEMEDISYFMPLILALGMSLWFLYGILLHEFPIIIANGFGVSCCCVLLVLKRIYS